MTVIPTQPKSGLFHVLAAAATAVVLLGACAETRAADWLTSWAHRKRVAIDHTQVDATLTNFPVLVRLSSANFSFVEARADGFDVQFAGADGVTALAYDRENHDAGQQAGIYWVRVPLVSDNAETAFYMYYGRPDATDPANPHGTWTNAYAGVWHLKEDPSGTAPQMKDSTRYGGNGTAYGSMTSDDQVPGYFDGCIEFDGVDDQTLGDLIRIPRRTAYRIDTQMTIEAWAKRADGNLICWQGQVSGALNTYSLSFSGATLEFQTRATNDAVKYVRYANSTDATEWHSYAGTYDGAELRLYRDGLHVATSNQTGNLKWADSANYDLGIGHGVPTTAYQSWHFGGCIDEVRLSRAVRSAAWLKACFDSQKADSTFLSFGPQEPPAGTVVTIL